MTANDYLKSVLSRESLLETSPEMEPLRKEREKIEQLLNDEFGSGALTIRYGGSKMKNTMIRENYDLDIICYLKHDDDSAGETLKEIYENVQEVLENEYFVVPKRSALCLKSKEGKNDTHIDVVPGRFMSAQGSDVFLYQAKGEKNRLQTNLDVHINHVKDSKLNDTIRLIKLWKELNSFDIPTFILELLVIKILKHYSDESGLDVCLKKFWEELKKSASSISIEDPANPNGNDLSNIWNSATKHTLAFSAEQTLSTIEQNGWENTFERGASQFPDAITPPETKPWCNI